ncbi:phospholipase A2 inhibitor and Ly6/PLAUR domain-containing protein-like [Dermochelys coriacea]|uniref:phospholipase A2 inhibitor and Ly6/PLAUR domain-containing protein-like n=1 Tax=Dermochelys coriacea TaxID=27794 RepID=UPI001CA958B1|nr:phospholipase A2 inhibitor and Ly6/PLAUR domain-containing protein-like [Dermochelys coriacea]
MTISLLSVRLCISPCLFPVAQALTECQTGPIINTVYTGGRCPICFSPGQSSCSSKETLQCEGRASQCISISGQILEDDITIPFAASGCATPNACELKKGEILNSGVFTYKITQIECYTPSSAQRMLGPFVLGSILPSLAGLLAVKFLS